MWNINFPFFKSNVFSFLEQDAAECEAGAMEIELSELWLVQFRIYGPTSYHIKSNVALYGVDAKAPLHYRKNASKQRELPIPQLF